MANKCRNMTCLLYPQEDETHRKALEYIKLNYDYAYIVHDKDTNEDGEIKKSHVHVVIRFINPRHISSVAKELGIEANYIESIQSRFDSMLCYLIHYNQPDKYQYSLDEVEGTLKDDLVKALNKQNKQPEEDEVLFLLGFIKNLNHYMSYEDFVEWACSQHMYATYRRNASFFKEALYNRNLQLNKLVVEDSDDSER